MIWGPLGEVSGGLVGVWVGGWGVGTRLEEALWLRLIGPCWDLPLGDSYWWRSRSPSLYCFQSARLLGMLSLLKKKDPVFAQIS